MKSIKSRNPVAIVFFATLLAAALALAPASQAANASYNAITFEFMNLTGKQIVIEGALLTQGRWVQGMQPIPQTQYANNSTVGPFATKSATYGNGNGGVLYTNVGTITWSMSWNGTPAIRVQNNDSSIKAMPALPSPMADPDNQHVRYTFQLIKQ